MKLPDKRNLYIGMLMIFGISLISSSHHWDNWLSFWLTMGLAVIGGGCVMKAIIMIQNR